MSQNFIRQFFQNGGRASQYELSRMYGMTNEAVRAAIYRLRHNEKMPISKVLYTNRINESYYQLVPEMVIPRKGRPARKFAVNAI